MGKSSFSKPSSYEYYWNGKLIPFAERIHLFYSEEDYLLDHIGLSEKELQKYNEENDTDYLNKEELIEDIWDNIYSFRSTQLNYFDRLGEITPSKKAIVEVINNLNKIDPYWLNVYEDSYKEELEQEEIQEFNKEHKTKYKTSEEVYKHNWKTYSLEEQIDYLWEMIEDRDNDNVEHYTWSANDEAIIMFSPNYYSEEETIVSQFIDNVSYIIKTIVEDNEQAEKYIKENSLVFTKDIDLQFLDHLDKSFLMNEDRTLVESKNNLYSYEKFCLLPKRLDFDTTIKKYGYEEFVNDLESKKEERWKEIFSWKLNKEMTM
ncbi:Uncharacterised protein [Mycoplasmopsis columboralis]|uniref:Uncharacterized protein n=1 Tax=Mycoplasmopsis columboralis TaxID=171282 RepID=A0A449B5J7_9BACT|nr:hypothetical protein [Mycoplasmopsis columboralis]VEU75852.1 Uncharacterised protein [Mycoplasmopsis columboralis]